jgi:hypothetical protein
MKKFNKIFKTYEDDKMANIVVSNDYHKSKF